MKKNKMAYKLITFQIRIKDNSSLTEMASRVEQALNCHFTPVQGKDFPGRETLATELLGLQLTLTYWLSGPNKETRTYWLTGAASEDILELGGELIEVSEFMLAVLHRRDKGDWYIPTMKEKYLEAGLPWTEEES